MNFGELQTFSPYIEFIRVITRVRIIKSFLPDFSDRIFSPMIVNDAEFVSDVRIMFY